MLKPNQLQSLIALNRARINEQHQKVEVINAVVPLLKVMAKFSPDIKDKLVEGYKIRDSVSKDIVKYVDLQKALKAELKEAYEVENKPKKVVFSIDEDGQPAQDGKYYALYRWHPDHYRGEVRYFVNGAWYYDEEGNDYTAFGNEDTQGERYVAVV